MAYRHQRTLAALAALAGLAACTVGPDYVRPPVATPAAYKEIAGWKPGAPQDASDRGAWWSVYKDAVLDELEQRVEVSNQNVFAAEAAYRAAVAAVRQAQAAFFPTVTLDGSATRSKASSTLSRGAKPVSQYDLSLGASWDIDVWGKIRRTVESNVATAQASGADLANARLSAQGALATAYFQLRVEDELKRLLDATAEGYAKSLEITRNKYAVGNAARSDVAQAETQLDNTRAQAINVGVQRAQLEHAIAVLIGKPPAEFNMAPVRLAVDVPAIPVGVPSTLLERRPDIAAAERKVAAANAQIGVAIAAYYPDLTLAASTGLASNQLGTLFQTASNVWSLGPQLALTVFDAGARSAQVQAARASYDESVADYRETVLTAFQQVEDELAALRILEEQAKVQDAAVKEAEEAAQLILNQYKAGTIDYTSVVTAQATALGDEETALNVLESRLTASVALIQALGGGWEGSQLPSGQPAATGFSGYF